MKILFDYFFAVFGLVLFFPIFVLISLLIKLNSKGPIFFIQKRIGQNGDGFNIIKFRTMYCDHQSNQTITIYNDKRITRVGLFLRNYKLDELPELINIIKGEMSFVGPRPDVEGYADKLKGEDKLILRLKPGITGPASLKYANEEQILSNVENPQEYNDNVIFPDKVRLNLEYYYNHNLWLDIKIIFATIKRIVY